MQSLTGRVAVVTGAASGIGAALAQRFAAEGMQLVLADVEQDPLARIAADLQAQGVATLALRTDVSKPRDVEALAQQTLERFGAVHVLCNNAGVASFGYAWERSVADWEWVLGVNLWGVIHGIRSFVPIMLRQGAEGHIVNTASMAGLTTLPLHSLYQVSKHGVVTLSESLHHELSLIGSKLKVSVLCPGWVDTQIGSSERNRPAPMQGDAGPAALRAEEARAREWALQSLAVGMPAAEVAACVLAAIREERFYILTHPDWNGLVRTRMQDILEARNPALDPNIQAALQGESA
jgi:NAD(P)-dependent dehydrogenase (short-subunit alcohol dehydrogenase family)